ncbi:MAG: hypothetical protein ACREP7_09310 [Lysobacter sp.]
MNEPDPSLVEPPRADPPAPADTTAADLSQLDILGVLYYVLAGITAVFSLIPIVHVTMGLAMINGRFGHGTGPGMAPPPAMGWMFVIMGSAFIVGGLACAVLFLMNASRLRQRRSHLFCIVASAISCALMPFGTLLGVFAVIVLSKPQVKALFNSARG